MTAALLLVGACGGGSDAAGAAGAVLAPRSPAFRILSPSDGGAANESHPLVRWTARAGVEVYRVRVYDDADPQRLLEQHDVVGATEWRLGGTYAHGRRLQVEVLDARALDRGPRTGRVRFELVVLPPGVPVPELVVSDARAQGGLKLFHLIDVGTPPGSDKLPILLLANAAGEIVWFHLHPEPGVLTDPRVLPNGHLSYIVRQVLPNERRYTGFEVDWDGREIWRSRDGALVHHELGPGPNGNKLYLTYIAEEVDGFVYEGEGIELADPVTGDVVWDWSIFDHFRPEDFPVPEASRTGLGGLGGDWSHANAVVWDPARSVLWLSIRHFERIVGIDYPSGQIRVTLGQDGLGGDGVMSHQHAPEVQADGSLLFWDNGNRHDPPVSAARQVVFDEQAGTLEVVWEWRDDPPFFDVAVGDANRQPNGNVLITAGVSRRLIEVDPASNDIVWELGVNDPRWWIYRCTQVPEGRIPRGILPFDD